MRRPVRKLLLLLVLAALGWATLWLFPFTSPKGSSSFSLLSWNLHGLHTEEGQSTEMLILDGIRSVDPDILCFQEFPVSRRGEEVRFQLRAMGYTHEALFSYNHAQTEAYSMGMAIYSRFPIKGKQEHPLMPNGEGRLVGLVDVDVEGRSLQVATVHMPNSDIHLNGKRAMLSAELAGENLRTLQSQDLLDRLAPLKDGPLVVAGDFNTFPLSAAWRILHGTYHDAFRPWDWSQGTFHITSELDVKIDHIFHTSRVRSRDARVLGLAGSDHRPVLARLQF